MRKLSRIISLNIRHGGSDRIQTLIGWLLAKTPDLVVIPEWQDNHPGGQLTSALQEQGFHVEHLARPGPRTNGVLMAAREPFSASRLTPVQASHGELLLGEWVGGLSVIASYFPQLEAKRPFFVDCLTLARTSVDVPLLLIGDLNTGRNDIDLEEGGTPFSCRKEFEELSKSGGLVDLWRTQHGFDAREWSWRSTKKGFRIDHAFANAAFIERFKTINCYFDHEPRECAMTDHSALFVDVGGF